MNLYLVGYRCTGKTSVGRKLAEALEWVFVDMDYELEVEEGMSTQEIVASRGWQYFRELEGQLLERLSQATRQVIATGGGVVTAPENIAIMRASGRAVWLHAGPGTIAKRMAADSNTVAQRPPLLGSDSFAEVEEVLAERLPLYQQTMHLQVGTDDLSLEAVAQHVLAWLDTELQGGS
ncbi:MAG: shikimate kinase [Deltaproteobacteria bacterium]|nr:MAG: shikimate kinase [Deltaproteobacteria bacterium]